MAVRGAGAIIAKLRGLADPPDEIEVEFGLTLNAEAGAFVAVAGAEANYTVKLTWKQEEKPTAQASKPSSFYGKDVISLLGRRGSSLLPLID